MKYFTLFSADLRLYSIHGKHDAAVLPGNIYVIKHYTIELNHGLSGQQSRLTPETDTHYTP
ncbi:Protein of unknown function [Thermobacillus xylanilyticus]|uniref:Uncharacterized protein n=1 Tax=Thermobacillus xylanilyticus TaxID=76633 RepID=A0ABM8UZL8_THEXY|nr:Protein of unknown function [Thermobacillus xylanilyticus]